SVATTAMTVLVAGGAGFPDPPKGDAARTAFSVKKACFSLSYAPATRRPSSGSTMSPTALTTASAPTVPPPGTGSALLPRPPFIAYCGPAHFPTVAPVPAPTPPSATGAADAASHAA